jgi:uncharacterized radical SAM protein YgiQ
MSMEEAEKQDIDQFDIILVSGDAYVDHPSFGTAVIGRVLWDAGYTVGIIAQPDWKDPGCVMQLGKPRLFFGISSGNVDSMVAHYAPSGRARALDSYSPAGVIRRPDRASLVYADLVHARFPKTPIVLGGLEASLRRFAHYDAWDGRVRQSLLADAPADMIVFGMAERQMVTIAEYLRSGTPIGEIRDIPGTVWKQAPKSWRLDPLPGTVLLPSFDEVSSDPWAYARAFGLHHGEQDPFRGRSVVQPHKKTVIIQNPPAHPLGTDELDHVYELPYTRRAHPSYREPIPALETVRFSITSHRGCFGGCSFCSLTHHQGGIIQSRSPGSIEREARAIAAMPEFTGTITDVGGPSANMYGMSCGRWYSQGTCPDRDCLSCASRSDGHGPWLSLLQKLQEIPKVRHVFVSSGIRYDLIPSFTVLQQICDRHVSGHLKVAPEHIADEVLILMRKPRAAVFLSFLKEFEKIQRGRKKRQYIVPYLMSGHPGCTITHMIALIEFLMANRVSVEQVQDFTPTPMTASTCMYHTGINPFTLKKVHVPKGREKKIQRAFLGYRDPANSGLIREGLIGAGRTDLIGHGPCCLVPPPGPGELSGTRRRGDR